jgi:uncharacterized protein YyaL (SSP411 family)
MNNFNSLINSKSLYLKSHALNPINCFEWNEDILKSALDQNKMIFLSIGYYSCYWCHVMEKEVFNHKDVADILNEYFINIKVDEEESPEIDSYYINCMYLMNGYAGYPANFILTLNLKPFVSFTYLPKNQFKNLILNVIDFFYNQKDKVYEIANDITKNISLFFNSKFKNSVLDYEILELNLEKIDRILYSNLDINGGFSDKPKFPPHQILEYLLTKFEKVKNKDIYTMFSLTLDKMMLGGIYDHIDFGFYRYSVDNTWTIPHFEKMLYDNSYLLFIYAKAFTLTNNWYYFTVFYEIWDFLKREFLIIDEDNESAFISSTNAITYINKDEFEEGAYYLFNYNEIKSVLDNNELNLFKEYYDFDNGNFYNFHSNKIIITKNNFEPDFDTYIKLNQIKIKLRDYRKKRYNLLKDTKIIASWNLILSLYLIRAYKELNDYLIYYKYLDTKIDENIIKILYKIKEEFKLYSIKIVNFILNRMFKDNKLYHVYYDDLKISNYLLLEDYVSLLLNLVEQKRIFKNLNDLNINVLISNIKDQILKYFYKNDVLYDNFYLNDLNNLNTVSFLDSAITSNLSMFLNAFYYIDRKIFIQTLSNYLDLINLYPLSCFSLAYNVLLFLFNYNLNYNFKLIDKILFIANHYFEIKINNEFLDLKKIDSNCYFVFINKIKEYLKENNLDKLDLKIDICNDRECYSNKLIVWL